MLEFLGTQVLLGLKVASGCRVMVEEFPAQGLGSRLPRLQGLGRGVPALWFGLTIVSVPSLWLKGCKIRLWVEG